MENRQWYMGPPSGDTILTQDGVIFTLQAGEMGFIQNLATTALAVKLGTGATPTSCHFLIRGSTATSDVGEHLRLDEWIGPVSVAAMTGTPSFIAWKATLNIPAR